MGGDCFTPAELGNDEGNCFILGRRAVSCEAALRILSNGESCPPCEREIPDIFLPGLREMKILRNDDVVFSLGGVPVSVCVLTTGVVIRRRAASGETARGGFGLGDSFTPSGEDGTRGLVFLFGGCSGVGGGLFHTLRRGGTRGLGRGRALFPAMCQNEYPAEREMTSVARSTPESS